MHSIGFIGLGNMGKGMSTNLSKRKIKVSGFDINDEVFLDLKSSSIKVENNLENLVKNNDVIITMLPDGPIVKNVWGNIIQFAKKHTILIDCSTIDVKTSIEIQKKANENYLYTLDAPVSGGVMGANKGTLTFMVGGNNDTFQKVKYLFDIMGNKAILCGDFGAGQTAKICNNMLLASTMIALGESFNLAKNLGLDFQKLYDVLSTSSGSCWAINNYCPFKGIGPESPADNNFSGGFSTNLMFKDLSLAIEAAKSSCTEVNFGHQSQKAFKKMVDQNKGELDFSSIVNEI